MPGTLSPFQVLLRILFPFALGYYLSYFFRVVNAVLSTELAGELGLGPQDLGLLTAAYFITFAAAQLPLGLLLDRYGPQRIEAALLLCAALGALLFALGNGGTQLIIGRGLIGLGVSACLMAAFKAFTQWFPPQRLPLVNGVIMASGGVGALTATVPVQAALELTDWRGIFLLLAGLTLLTALIVLLLVPDHPLQPKGETLTKQLAGLRTVFTDRFFWKVAPLAMFSQASFLSIQGLWAGPWLRDVAALSSDSVAERLLLIACSMLAGFLGMGFLVERLSRLGIRPVLVAGGGMFLFGLVQVVIVLVPTEAWITLTWMLFGFFGTTGIIQYAVLSQYFPRHLSGRVNTSLNLLVFVSAFVLQWAIGAVIERWPPAGPGRYAAEGYRMAFGSLVLLQLTGFAWFLVSPGSLYKNDPDYP